MRRIDPFAPFLAHEDVRQRGLPAWRPGGNLDDLLEAPDRAALERHFALPRVRLIALVAIAVSLLFLGRLLQLQIVVGATYREQAEHNRVKRERIAAARGVILDRHGAFLTANEPQFLLKVIPKELPTVEADRERLLGELETASGLGPDQIRNLLREPDDDGTVTLLTFPAQDQAIRAMIQYQSTPGVSVAVEAARTYPLGEASSHVVGYIGKPTRAEVDRGIDREEQVGKTGLEHLYQNELAGTAGVREVERDSRNREQRVIATQAPEAGRNLRVSLDAGLQQRLYDDLSATVRQTRAPGGAAVALDPRTGELLALVSVPGFDSNALSSGLTPEEYQVLTDDPHLPLFFRTIAGEYPSGSTIKPFIAAAALDKRIITPNTQIASSGGLRVGAWFFPDWKSGGHGLTNVTKALAESVNTFFYTIGGGFEDFRGLGIEAMTSFVRKFGFGRTLGIDLLGERPGFLPSMEWKERVKGERWYIGDTYHFAIGQGDLLVTPLQLAAATAAVANGGTLYQPHVATAITDAEGRVVRSIPPEVLERSAATPASLATVRAGMREAVVSGSAQGLGSLPVPAAGKTGTAQFGNEEKTHSWFTAFAPYDEPSIVITVLVEAGGEGHESALPVARNAFSWYFSRGQ